MIDKRFRSQKQKLFEESADRTPHYSIRKYAVGAASVLLSTTLWMGANAGAVHADTVNDAATTEQVNTADQSASVSEKQASETASQAPATTAAPAANSASSASSAETANASQAAPAESQKSTATATAEAPKADNSASTAASTETQKQASETAETQADAQANVQKSSATSAEAAKQAAAAASQTVNASSVNTAASSKTANQLASSKLAVRRNAVMLAATPTKQANAVTYSDRKTGKNLLVYQLGSASYTTADQIKKYQNLGYKLVEDSTNGAAVSANGQAYSVVFDHDYMPVSPTSPGKPGQAINVDASGAKFPEGTDANSLQHDVKRTVTYVVQGGGDPAPAPKVDTLHFNALKMIDKVTGEVVSTKWDQDKDFEDANTPALAGYTPDKYFISNKGIHATQNDINEVVTYTADKQGVNVIYYDGTTGRVIKTDNLQGGTHTKSGYNTAEKVKQYTNNGYELVSDTAGGKEIVFDNDNGSTQNYTITLAHTYLTVNAQNPGFPGSPMNQDPNGTKWPEGTDIKGLTNTVTRTVNYVVANGKKQAPASVTNGLKYTAEKTIDRVTGQVTKTVWSGNQDFNDVSTPALKGYTADKQVVSYKNIAHDHPAIVETVTYSADAQKATVAFVDSTTGKTLAIKTVNGKTLENSAYTTGADIKSYTDNGYALVSDTTNGKSFVFDDDDNATQEFTVTLKHTFFDATEANPGKPGEAINADKNGAKWPSGTDKASLAKDVVRTITYKTTDGSKAPAGLTQSLHFSAVKTVDRVTGQVTKTVWSNPQDFADVASPAIKGYTADQKVLVDKGITHEHSAINEVVTYTPDAQKASVTFKDGQTGNILSVKDLTGVTNAKSGYTTKASIDGYTALGYVLTGDDTKGAEVVYDNEDGADQKYTVTFKHGVTTITADKAGKPGQPINPDANGAKWPEGTDAKSLKDSVTRTITYTVIGGKDQAPKNVVQTLNYNATKVVDNVTGQVLSTTWSGKQNFQDVGTPALAGYTADKKLIVNHDVAHDASDIHEVVTYTPDAQKAIVTFTDKATGKTLKVQNLTGVTHAGSGYNTKGDIKAYLDLGYALVSDSTNGAEVVFDNDDKNDQSFSVVFTHGSTTVSIKNPGKPGQAINPGKGSAVWPEGTDAKGLTDTVTRTISYKVVGDKDPAPKGDVQTLTFTAEKTIDNVTGQVTKTVWSAPQDFKDVATPALKGYTASKAVASDKNIAHDHAAINEVISYNPDAQKASVTFTDKATGKTLKMQNLTGVTHAESGYKTASDIKAFQDLGYTLVSDSTNGLEVVFDNDDKADQSFSVVFTHGSSKVTIDNPGKPGQAINPGKGSAVWPEGTDKAGLTKTVSRTITYKVVGNKDKAPEGKSQTLTYTAVKTVDNVTGQVTETVWSAPQNFEDVATPAISGYTADKTVVSDKNIAHDHANIATVVTYNPDVQKGSVTYIDQTTGKTLKVENLTGVTHADAGYTTKSSIDTYKNLGYTLVSDTTEGKEIVYDNDDAKDQGYTVAFKHGSVTVTVDNPGKPGEEITPGGAKWPEGTDKAGLTKTVSRTITYKMSDGSKAPDPVTQTLTFTATKTIDTVTGEVTSTDWEGKKDFEDVATPKVAGYTPDAEVASAKGVAYDAGKVDTTVTYKADAQKATVTYVDADGKVLLTKTLDGVSNGHSGYSTISTIKDFENKGYVLVSDSTTGNEIVFDTDDKADQAFTVSFKHGTSLVTAANPINPVTGQDDSANLIKKVHQTIKYVKVTGKRAAKSNVQTLTFQRNETIDAVTGEVLSYGDWDGIKETKAVTSPVVKGFKASKKIVKGQTYTAESGDKVITVTYSYLDKAVKKSKKSHKKAAGKMTNGGSGASSAGNGAGASTKKTQATGLTISKASAVATASSSQKKLPQTGESKDKSALFGLGLASILGGIGILGASKRKKKEN